MAFQGTITPRGHIEQLAELDGAKIVGTKIKAPYAINPEVYVLPMDNVLATKVRIAKSTSLERELIQEVGNGRRHIRTLRFTRRLPDPNGPTEKDRILQNRSCMGIH